MNEKELRQLINEVTAEIIAESPINPGDGEFTEEEGLLLQQLSDDAVEEEPETAFGDRSAPQISRDL